MKRFWRALRLGGESRALRRREWLPPAAYRDHVRRRLRRVLDAAGRVPHYRELYRQAGVRLTEIRTPEDLGRLPITTSRALREAPREAVVVEGADFGALLDRWSSGSTGITLHTYLTPLERDRQALNALRVYRAGGYRPRDLLLDLMEPDVPRPRWIERLGLYRKRYVPIREPLQEHVDRIAALRPDVVLASPTLLELLAEAAAGRGFEIRPRLIFTVGERLSAARRRLAREVFGAEPIDVYGASEFGPIAFQCGVRDGYHINADSLLVEIVEPETGDPLPAGRVGRVVITGLIGEVMPLVRYSVGDLAVRRAAPCPCGRGLPLLEAVEGREIQMLRKASGERVSPWAPTIVLEETPGVHRYQLVQERPGALTVRVEGGPIDEADVTGRLRRVLGDALAVDFEYPGSLAPAGHKFCLVISHVREE